MGKALRIIIAALLLSLFAVSPSFSSVGIKVDDVLKGTATDLEFTGSGDSITNDGSTFTFNLLLSGMANGGATSMATNETTVSPSYGFIRKAIASDTSSPSYATGTLADGTPGAILTIFITVVEGSGTFTLTPATATGWSTVLFNAVGDQVTLFYVDDTTGWVIIAQNSITVTQP